jgi:hypothetical protein
MSRLRFVPLAFALSASSVVACSGSGDGTAATGSAQLTSPVGQGSFVPADAIAFTNLVGRPEIVLTDYAGACAEAQNAFTKPRSTRISILLPSAVAGMTYPVDAARGESGAYVSLDTHNADCTSGPPAGSGTGGHVTITEADPSAIRGTFELTFDVTTSRSSETDTITGSFVSPICAGAAEAMGAAEHITCQ